MIMNNYDYLFKYILIGDSNVGKSCMLLRLVQGRFRSQHEATLGVQFGSKTVNIKQKGIKLQVWDTAGQESFKSITRAYYKGSIAALLVFDITSEKSFDDINSWYYELKTHSHRKLSIALIGNKKDLVSEREVSQQRARQFARENGFFNYYQISALSGQNVEKPFIDLATEVLTKIETGEINLELDSTNAIKVGPKNKAKFVKSNLELLKEPSKKEENQKNCAC